MNYHNITKEDMLNGEGLRTVLWVAGCEHHCPGCQNPITWDYRSGIPFDEDAMDELMDSLAPDYISGLTLSGGDPLAPGNLNVIEWICEKVKAAYPNKTIWSYTGYTWKQLMKRSQYTPELKNILHLLDVLVDGEYIEKQRDIELKWRGSANQRVIDVQKSLSQRLVVEHCK